MKAIRKKLFYVSFVVYSFGVIFLTLLFGWRGSGHTVFDLVPRVNWTQDPPQIIPFQSIYGYFRMAQHDSSRLNHVLLMLRGNILLLFPLGLYLPRIFQKANQFGTFVGMAFMVTLCIEITQLLTGRGAFDVDDLILNTLGAVIGFYVFKLLGSITMNIFKLKSEKI